MPSFPFKTFLAALLASSCFVPVAQAAAITWDGSTGDWFTTTNWTGGILPGSEDVATINAGMATVGLVGATATTVLVGNSSGLTGALTIQSAGAISDTTGSVANAPNSMGTATVTGVGAKWTNSGNLIVGQSGNGELSILAGGEASDSQGIIGGLVGSTGIATVSGLSSTWQSSTNLFVGNYGSGILLVTNGGSVSDVGAYIGRFSGSVGTSTVSGAGSIWSSSGMFAVGQSGSGTLTISDGGAVYDDSGFLGVYIGATGTATVSGYGSRWVNTSGLYIGNGWFATGSDATGTLKVLSAGSVEAALIVLGVNSNTIGTLTVSDSGTVSTSGVLTIAEASGSTGTLNIGAAAGDAAAAPGTVTASSGIVFGAGTGTIVFKG